jgi:hypothetical protein
MNMKRLFILAAMSLLFISAGSGQGRKYAVHQRGMLHETIYNTGEIGRTYDQGDAGITKGFPSFEWPGNSAFTVDGKYYSGQHNSFGGGMQLAATRRDTVARLYAYCGAISGLPVAGVQSFPQLISRTENYPVLGNGDLNPAYNPDEAEETIVSKWATPLGITITRTSRAWSHPDYDDFIIYEYELENTGDRDGIASTPNYSDTLTEVLVSFAYGLAPGKTGYERTFNRWSGGDYQQKDVYSRFDRRRWLSYATDRDGKPDPIYADEWARTGKNGGGLQSPQAVGYLQLYYDTDHLALSTQTQTIVTTADSGNVWDAKRRLKQPFLNRLETSLFSEAKYRVNMDIAQSRKNAPYNSLSIFGPDWLRRDAFNVRQSWYFAVGKMMIYGPYILKPGDKIRFSIAEVAGYGAARKAETAAGLKDEGGSCGQICGESASAAAFNPVPNYWQTVQYGLDNRTFGSTYLSTNPLPEYVNSNVVTVREVSDRAIQAYTNNALVDYDSLQYWPEQSPDHGVYKLPVVVPAPAITVENTDRAENRITWGPQVESFKTLRLMASFSHYIVSKSDHPLGSWKRLDSVGRGDVRYLSNGKYSFVDTATHVGESFYYSVVSYDSAGHVSGRTNITLHQTQLGGTEKLEQVYVVPNPFIVRSGFAGAGTPENMIGFYNLPKQCTIRILSYSGQLVETIEHDSGLYSTEYLQATRNNQLIAPGVYFYVVETPDGSRNHGKFVIIK